MFHSFLALLTLFSGAIQNESIPESIVKEVLLKNLEDQLQEGGPSFYWDDVDGKWKGKAELDFEIDWDLEGSPNEDGKECTAVRVSLTTQSVFQTVQVFETLSSLPQTVTKVISSIVFETETTLSSVFSTIYPDPKTETEYLVTELPHKDYTTNLIVTETAFLTETVFSEEIMTEMFSVTETVFVPEGKEPTENTIELPTSTTPNFFFFFIANISLPVCEEFCEQSGGQMAVLSPETLPKIKEAASHLGLNIGTIVGKLLNDETGTIQKIQYNLADPEYPGAESLAVVCSLNAPQ